MLWRLCSFSFHVWMYAVVPTWPTSSLSKANPRCTLLSKSSYKSNSCFSFQKSHSSLSTRFSLNYLAWVFRFPVLWPLSLDDGSCSPLSVTISSYQPDEFPPFLHALTPCAGSCLLIQSEQGFLGILWQTSGQGLVLPLRGSIPGWGTKSHKLYSTIKKERKKRTGFLTCNPHAIKFRGPWTWME